MARKSDVLRTDEVTRETNGKRYTVGYDVVSIGRSRAGMRLDTGQFESLGGMPEKVVALGLLDEIIRSGLADKSYQVRKEELPRA